jgi:hypothetical protein
VHARTFVRFQRDLLPQGEVRQRHLRIIVQWQERQVPDRDDVLSGCLRS